MTWNWNSYIVIGIINSCTVATVAQIAYTVHNLQYEYHTVVFIDWDFMQINFNVTQYFLVLNRGHVGYELGRKRAMDKCDIRRERVVSKISSIWCTLNHVTWRTSSGVDFSPLFVLSQVAKIALTFIVFFRRRPVNDTTLAIHKSYDIMTHRTCMDVFLL